MQELQFILGLLVILGLIGVIISFIREKYKPWRKSSIIMWIIFLVLFIISFASDVLTVGVIILAAGVILFLSLLKEINYVLKCSERIEATVIATEINQKNGKQYIAPVFQYIINGQTFTEISIRERYRYKKPRHEIGLQYKVYVNPKIPTDIVERRMIKFSDIVMLLLSVYMIGGGFFALYIFLKNIFL